MSAGGTALTTLGPVGAAQGRWTMWVWRSPGRETGDNTLQRLGVMTLGQGVLEQPAPRQAPTPEKRGWPRYDARATRAADRAPLGLEPGWHPL